MFGEIKHFCHMARSFTVSDSFTRPHDVTKLASHDQFVNPCVVSYVADIECGYTRKQCYVQTETY